ncbi:glycosyltransferase [Microbacterium rhizosphaerae]|uniref:Glycosyltransferase n=1 Tax=Microbacterium rhizosphaerae TaxID=1678237 RepID=A0ABZ0SSM2_9MICO|nr:glycosyltransferase [Microbacterium rhizosphaerae]WPR91425.1 glycosyltransferase [Microbacterium rhizosphaerae]
MDGPARYTHLLALTDHHGVFEHALLDAPRREHGYCVDDVARALIVVARDPEPSAELSRSAETYLDFLDAAIGSDGLVHNRMDASGEWSDEHAMGDWWGRLLWAAGTAAARASDPAVRTRALQMFRRAARQRSSELHTIAFAALGAAEVASAYPGDTDAARILRDLIDAIPAAPRESWPWPEPRLSYGNASIAEALIAAGTELGDVVATDRGLLLLTFLLTLETADGRLSVTGTGGRGPGEVGPQFDQQPIEVAAIADACARAYAQTGDTAWRAGVDLAWQWFSGRNDSGTPMIDHDTGAGFDGLERDGRNENRGAESTLAALSTHQQARRLGLLRAA